MDVKSRDHEFASGLLIKTFKKHFSNIKIKGSNFILCVVPLMK